MLGCFRFQRHEALHGVLGDVDEDGPVEEVEAEEEHGEDDPGPALQVARPPPVQGAGGQRGEGGGAGAQLQLLQLDRAGVRVLAPAPPGRASNQGSRRFHNHGDSPH